MYYRNVAEFLTGWKESTVFLINAVSYLITTGYGVFLYSPESQPVRKFTGWPEKVYRFSVFCLKTGKKYTGKKV